MPQTAAYPSLAGMRSAALIAMPSDAGVLGSLILLSAESDAFADADLDLLERVVTQLSLAIRNAQLYDEIKQMHLGNLKALSSALNAKDYYTLGHASRVSAYMVMLGRQLGWPDDLLAPLEEAAYLHDIGKISISDRVLLKPGRLNQQEWQQMRQHPVFSADIIRPLFPDDLVQAVRHHHEHYNGGGYPDGLAGEGIRCWRAPWPWWTPTTPCPAAGRTTPPSPTPSALRSCAAAAAPSSTRTWCRPSASCSTTWPGAASRPSGGGPGRGAHPRRAARHAERQRG